MPTDDKQLEAISLMRLLPAGAANIGAQVTRQELRDAGVGTWSTRCARSDDLRTAEERRDALADYDEVLPAESIEELGDEPVMELRFSGS